MRRLLDPVVLRHKIEVEKRTQSSVAKELGVSLSCVERTCTRLGLETQRTGPRSGDGHTNWKGGRYLLGKSKNRAYWYVYAPDHPNCTKAGYVAEHRLAMTLAIGRPLLPGEVVHHKDGNPQNNDLSNLQLFDANGVHLKHELTGRCPKWTAEGVARIAEVIRQSHIGRGHKVSDAQEHSRTTLQMITKAAQRAQPASGSEPTP